MKWLRYIKNRQGGQALVEFSLVSVVFFLMVFGMIDVGRAVWNYNTLAQATREGARYAIVHGADSTDPSGPGSEYYTAPDTDTKINETVQKFGSGLDSERLTVLSEWPDASNVSGNSVKVTSRYVYAPMFDFFGVISFTMTSSTTMKITN